MHRMLALQYIYMVALRVRYPRQADTGAKDLFDRAGTGAGVYHNQIYKTANNYRLLSVALAGEYVVVNFQNRRLGKTRNKRLATTQC